jgi:hypothetical protein
VAATNVRRLAAVDMYGTAGTIRRRRIILVEFIVGALACPALGASLLGVGAGSQLWLDVWLIGIGINYLPLAIHGLTLARPGALERELAGVDIGKELRRYGFAQVWILVPFLVAIVALFQIRRRQPTAERE